MRLDIPMQQFDLKGRRNSAWGLEELEISLKDCIRTAFEARQAVYEEEVRPVIFGH